jgi:23S rRNA (guanosine2251-2'-O)-methyltransferase
VQGIIIPKDRSAPLTGTVAKASAGAVAHMEICRVINLTSAIQTMQRAGIWVYGLAGQADRTIHGVDLTGPLCLVVGGEEKGVRPRIREACDGLLSIPMHGPLDSLNASAAAAIALFEAARQRTED